MCWKVITKSLSLAIRLCLIYIVLTGKAAIAEDVSGYLKRIGLNNGCAVSLGLNTYAFCAYLKINYNSTQTVGIAIWRGDSQQPCEMQLNNEQQQKLKNILTKFKKMHYYLSEAGPTFEVHGETVDVIVRRGMFELSYSESLSSTPNKKVFKCLIDIIRSIDMP